MQIKQITDSCNRKVLFSVSWLVSYLYPSVQRFFITGFPKTFPFENSTVCYTIIVFLCMCVIIVYTY